MKLHQSGELVRGEINYTYKLFRPNN